MYLVPLMPTGFNLTGVEYTITNLTVTFEWDGPQGGGPQAIVDNYIIIITPMPLHPSYVTVLPNTPLTLDVTLNYNTTYTATITAENCAGMSETFVYPLGIVYGTLRIKHSVMTIQRFLI